MIKTEHTNFITQLSYVFTWLNLEWRKTISITVGSNSHLLCINSEKSITTIYIYIRPSTHMNLRYTQNFIGQHPPFL